jgi:hypothetical protein
VPTSFGSTTSSSITRAGTITPVADSRRTQVI